MVISNIEILKTLTSELPFLDELIGSRVPNEVSWKMDKGTCVGHSLLDTPEVSVIQAWLSEGAIFPMHVHRESVEIVIVVQGTLQSETPRGVTTTGKGQVLILENHESHKHTALTPVWCVALTIPRSIGYPSMGGGDDNAIEHQQ